MLSSPLRTAGPDAADPGGFRRRLRERRRLAELDRSNADRAQQHLLRGRLIDAADLVRTGWTQGCWFVAVGRDDASRRVGPLNLHDLAGRTVSQVCLVGAVLQAGARDRLARRALDLTWATLHHEDIRWRPAPALQLARVQDLARWNDAVGRTAGEVAQLLMAAADAAPQGRTAHCAGATQ